jgi:hypothetical protein
MRKSAGIPSAGYSSDHARRFKEIIMAAKKQTEDETKETRQHKRFVEKARELGCDESEEAFDQALGKIAKAPPPKTVQKRKAKKPAK